MSYSKSLIDFIISMRGGSFFLSPREKIFLEVLEEMGVPEEVVKEGIEICLGAVDPRKRSKYPVFLCMKKVLEIFETYRKHNAIRETFDWRERFNFKIQLVRDYIDAEPPPPASEEDAERILMETESKIMKQLWDKLGQEKKKRILEAVSQFRKEDDIYKELVKREIRKIYGLPVLSLYVD